MKGTGEKRNVCPGSCVSTGAKFPVAPVESAPMVRLYYTVWSKSAVGNADCSLKNIFIVSFIIIFGTLSFPTADFDQTV